MKKQSKKSDEVEYISWKNINEIGEERIIHAVCFVIKETKNYITISLTKNASEYTDIEKIENKYIISRFYLTQS